MRTICGLIVLVSFSMQLTVMSGQTLEFTLQGAAGPGVTAENEPNPDVIDGGSGGLGSEGCRLNLSNGVLSVDLLWGSENGFTDLSSDVDFMNIHGPTDFHAPDSFFINADTFVGLSN